MKTGVRPDDPATFYAMTAWAFDACDLRPDSRAEVLARVQQVLRMREPVMVAREFAERLLADAGAPTPADDLTDAIGELECIFAEANTTGVIHASPKLSPHLVSHMLVSRSGIGWATPSGHTVVVDGGYRAALGDSLFIASSALFGWRVQPEVRSVPDVEDNMFAAICERSCLIGFEQALGAVSVEVGS